MGDVMLDREIAPGIYWPQPGKPTYRLLSEEEYQGYLGILREFAEKNPKVCQEEYECPYCIISFKNDYTHEDTCLWRRARKLLGVV